VLGLAAGTAAAIFAAAALGITLNVILRNVVGTPIHGLLDAVEYGLLLATFLGAPWVLAQGAHVTVDLLTAALPDRLAFPLARLMALVGAAASAVVLVYGWQAMAASMARGSMIRTSFTIPEWWTLAVVPLSFGLIALEFLRQAIWPPGRHRSPQGL
jgi:TRAP-type C4-dicarboxylate transport system permease small subunit